MENSNDIIELLDTLYGMVNEAWGVPLGNDKCIIEREKAIDIINTIKANLPTSIAESKRLVQARDEFIGNAKREAENLRKSAEDHANKLIDQQEILRAAKIKSETIIAEAETKSNELRKVACDYVDNAISKAEITLTEALEAVRKTQNSFRNADGNVSSHDNSQAGSDESDKKVNVEHINPAEITAENE